MNKRKLFYIIICLFLVCGCAGCGLSPKHQLLSNESFVLEKFDNGDAKFYGDSIITGREDSLVMLGLDGAIKEEFKDINVNWIDGIPEEGLVVYGNFKKETGIIQLNENGVFNGKLYSVSTKELWIDQTLSHFGDRYYMTATEIEGNINNGDPDAESGNYIIHLFESYDAKNWTWVSDIANESHNLEDVNLSYINGIIYVCYEKEVLDKKESAIVLRYSLDYGVSFSDEIVLLDADCDHEPEGFYSDEEGGYRLFYSCDRDNKGSSYMGAKAYVAYFDRSLSCIQKDVAIETATNQGVVWYDYMKVGNKEYFLYAGNALTENNMILEVWE